MTELVTTTPIATTDPGALVAWATAASAAHDLAETLVRTQICPEPFRNKPGEATAVILLGAEIGLTPIAALRSMYVIRGQVGMYVRAQLALALGRGHRIWTEHEDDSRVVVAGHRAGDPEHVERVEWTIERARIAGLIRRGASGAPSQYETQPRAMLWARAAGDVARRIAADALQGVPELDDAPEERSPSAAPSGATRTVQRYRAALPMPEPVPELVGSAAPDAPPRPVPPERKPATAPNTEPERPPAPEIVNEPEPTDDPAGEPGPALLDPPEPALTEPQRIAIMAGLNGRGVRGHDARVAWIGRFLGRELATTNDLTVTEASAVLDRLAWETETSGGTDDHR